MGQIIDSYPKISLRKTGTAFSTLARAIVGQQISVKAAQSIWNKFVVAVKKVDPKSVLAVSAKKLRSCGLSESKVTYIRDLAQHFFDKRVNPRSFKNLSDEELIETLVEIRGIGRWTAEMFLIFHLQRPDVLPVDDLGLVRAVEKNYFDGKKISKDQIREIATSWSPYRSVATWYLWRSLEPKPVEY